MTIDVASCNGAPVLDQSLSMHEIGPRLASRLSPVAHGYAGLSKRVGTALWIGFRMACSFGVLGVRALLPSHHMGFDAR